MTQFTPPQGIFYSLQAFQLQLFQAVAGPLQVLQDWDRNLFVRPDDYGGVVKRRSDRPPCGC